MCLSQFRRYAPSLVLATSVLAAACGGGAPADGPAAPAVIAIDGSSTVYPVTEAVAEEFQKTMPGTHVTVGRSGTGGGFQKFCRNETVISNASRPITATEIDACQKSGATYVELPVAYDGLTVVVHPKNTWATSITVAELKKLWEPAAQGKVTRWNQIRPSWPNQEVHLFGPGVDSGTFDYFTEVINGKAKASRGDYTSSEDDNVLVQGVAGDTNALGYMGLAYYVENKERMKLVAVDDGDPPTARGRSSRRLKPFAAEPIARSRGRSSSTSTRRRSRGLRFRSSSSTTSPTPRSSSRKSATCRSRMPSSNSCAIASRPRRRARCIRSTSTLSAHASLEERLKAK